MPLATSGDDVVGSVVKIEVKKPGKSQLLSFSLTRSDIRTIEKLKDLYLKVAELQGA